MKLSLQKYCEIHNRQELLEEWDQEANQQFTPATVSYGSHYKASWRCSLGHQWNALVNERVGRMTSCPYCSSKKVLPGFNDLAALYPNIAEELIGPFKADEVTAHSNKLATWRCEKGHEWEVRVGSRTRHGSACPYCTNHKVLPGFNDLATHNPSLVDEWYTPGNLPLTPYMVTPGSSRKVSWQCRKGHIWKAAIHSRTTKKTECPYCRPNVAYIKKVSLYDWCIHNGRLDVLNSWREKKNRISTSEVDSSSCEEYSWRCVIGHTWTESVVDRVQRKVCPQCAESIKYTHPEIAKEWDTRRNTDNILKVSNVTTRKQHWVCAKNHTWEETPAKRIKTGQGCPICEGRELLAGFNDVGTLYPELTKEWDYMANWDKTPSKFLSTSKEKVHWRCKNGHVTYISIAAKVAAPKCPYCK